MKIISRPKRRLTRTRNRFRRYNEFDIDPEWNELDEETLKLSAMGEWPRQ